MAILFKADTHTYTSIDPSENITWTSVTGIISKQKKPFDADAIAAKSVKNNWSKWYGMTETDVKEAWRNESQKAVNLGTWYHNQRELAYTSCSTIEKDGCIVPIFKPVEIDGIKNAPDQKLVEGIYPEHMTYLKSAGLCGQADRIEVINGKVNIYDYKTNKEIKTKSYINWEGVSDKMLDPVNHLDDCNLNHYSLQLSFYMYMILKHNPRLKPGKMIIEHILFEEAGKDAYDNRIVKYDDFGEPVVQEIVQYDVPYLKTEVINIINRLKENVKA
jgi:hypothetical protein